MKHATIESERAAAREVILILSQEEFMLIYNAVDFASTVPRKGRKHKAFLVKLDAVAAW